MTQDQVSKCLKEATRLLKERDCWEMRTVPLLSASRVSLQIDRSDEVCPAELR